MNCGLRIADCGLADTHASRERGVFIGRGVIADAAAFVRVWSAIRGTTRDFS
jgi:hypothetical protein